MRRIILSSETLLDQLDEIFVLSQLAVIRALIIFPAGGSPYEASICRNSERQLSTDI